MFLFAVVITGFLFTRGPTLLAATRALARRVDPNYGEHFLDLAGATIRAVSRGVIGISLLQAIIGGVGVALAGAPFASLLTLAILVLGIVQIGPVVVIIPLAIWGWMELSTGAALAFTVCMVAVYLVEAVMKPFVLAHGLKTPMLVILIGVIGGILEHGIPGLFAGPIVLAVAWEVAKAWIYEREDRPAAVQTAPAAAALPSPIARRNGGRPVDALRGRLRRSVPLGREKSFLNHNHGRAFPVRPRLRRAENLGFKLDLGHFPRLSGDLFLRASDRKTPHCCPDKAKKRCLFGEDTESQRFLRG